MISGKEIMDVFEAAPSQGVSANFCDAVADLARRGHGIGVSLSWAAVRPADAHDGKFQFAESTADVFTQGAQLLRRNSPFNDAHVVGEIVGLDRQRREEFDGHSNVVCELDGRPVALKVQFQSADYDEVFRAFRDGIQISIDGDIHSGRPKIHATQSPQLRRRLPNPLTAGYAGSRYVNQMSGG